MNALLYVMLGGLVLLLVSAAGAVIGTAAWLYRQQKKRKARARAKYGASLRQQKNQYKNRKDLPA